jgi:CRISPR-associated endoribonuclease Cas6
MEGAVSRSMAAVVLHLQPIADGRLAVSHGGFAYAAALDLLLRLDPALSRTLHLAAPRKPLTCSLLTGGQERSGGYLLLNERNTFTLRLTGLEPRVSECLLTLSPDLGGVRIAEAVFTIAAVCTSAEEHPEAGQDDYEAMWIRSMSQEPLPYVTLNFVAPTTFRIGRSEQPYPLPRLVFGSLAAAWNAHSHRPLPDLEDTIERRVVLSNWKGETRRVELGIRRTTGFIGRFTYRLLDPSAELARAIRLLSEYSFYAGVGWQTTQGMGQVRPQFAGERAGSTQ